MKEFLIFIVAIVIYFVPTILAFKRGNPNKGAVLIINFLLGWTIGGWVWALIKTYSVKPA